MLIINLAGIAILAVSLGAAFGIEHWIGKTSEGLLMIIAGPLAIVGDLTYRWWYSEGRWFHPGAGGALFFLPIWGFGILWLVLGIFAIAQGQL
jgi:hypothetical protein